MFVPPPLIDRRAEGTRPVPRAVLTWRLAVGLCTGLALLAAGCSTSSHAGSTPSVTPTPTPTAQVSLDPGTDAIGGSVSTDLHAKPVVVLPTAPAPDHLLAKDIVRGRGAVALPHETVTVQYLGLHYTGGEFDSSWSRHQAAQFPLDQVIPGFAQGIAGMRVGGRRELVIPPALAYGAGGQPPTIGANETLIFVIDLVSIDSAAP